jgi:Tfp pilus assembly protein PilE
MRNEESKLKIKMGTITIISILVVIFLMTGCGVPQSDYDKIKSENDKLRIELDSVKELVASDAFKTFFIKEKVSEARSVLKQIYCAAEAYYQEEGLYPPVHTFNNASTKESTIIWSTLAGLTTDKPSGYPPFSYKITISGISDFVVEADPSSSYNQLMHNVSTMKIDSDGIVTGGSF